MWEVMTACNSLGWPSARGFICSVKQSEFNIQFRKKILLSENSVSKTGGERISHAKNTCKCGGSVNKYIYVYIDIIHGHTEMPV